MQMLTKSKFIFFCNIFFLCFFTNKISLAAESSISIKAENIYLKYSIDADIAFTIKSKIYLLHNNGDTEYLRGINIHVFNKKHELIMTVHANKARMYNDKKLWLLLGDVELISINKKKQRKQINTELLYWDQEKEIIYNDNFLRLENDDSVITGKNFFAKQDFSYYKIKSPDWYTSVTRK